ncbi:2OG-Fe dioxygenase family protein [Pseudoalteromonas sp. OANN1]|uniref:2OG-Fe dioxygenase family protein n=1 Tax=Pseudoalteromonas sp. OANN1 TaxID=2954497 RepID=UPI0020982152|nr:2OG-Fe dioxygenase family protein [Pseudoalteromonas sp. OANN1]MCO7197582.1 2OG-Fe dioxygenase family protein [Pseudoalteromonas sp. OANN1]
MSDAHRLRTQRAQWAFSILKLSIISEEVIIMCNNKLTLKRDFVQLESYPEVLKIRGMVKKEMSRLVAGKNASNNLLRGIRWGIRVNDSFQWTKRNTYSLPVSLNSEESGKTREFTLISDEFISHPVIQAVLKSKFETWAFSEKSDSRAFEVQVSLIGYVATLTSTAFPAPVYLHQDMVDGSVTVLYIDGKVDGGITRVFDLNEDMIVEASLGEGESIFMVDEQTKHVVTPISVGLGSVSGVAKRLLMIVRFQPVGR